MAKKHNTYDQKAKEKLEKTIEALPEHLKLTGQKFLNKPKNPNRFNNKQK